MIWMRPGLKGGGFAPFGLAALLFILMPAHTGDQEPSAQAAPAPTPQAAITNPFGAIRLVTFSLPRPVGTRIPPAPVQLASATTADLDATGAIIDRAVSSHRESADLAPPAFPLLNRRLKGDFLAVRPPSGAATDTDRAMQEGPYRPNDDDIEAAARFVPFPEYDISLSLELHPQVPGEDTADTDPGQPDISLLVIANDPDPRARTSRLFFGDLVGSSLAGIVPWTAGEEPILMVPPARDGDLKRSALAALPDAAEEMRDGTPGDDTAQDRQGGETVAGKGEVTGDDKRPRTPAERLGLVDKTRQKAEKCLANAVYFEARGESIRGQIAVAQVVLNRAFSGYYPDDVCGVVYQNAHRHLACQFTFACDGIPDVVTEPEAWDRAVRIARATLDGKVWLPEIGKATHYHAYWVHPWWVRTMRKLTRIGVHSFYRPRRWGDGENAPSWGSATATAEAAARL